MERKKNLSVIVLLAVGAAMWAAPPPVALWTGTFRLTQ